MKLCQVRSTITGSKITQVLKLQVRTLSQVRSGHGSRKVMNKRVE